MQDSEDAVKQKVEKAYGKIRVPKAIAMKKQWEIGKCRILPKDKDINRTRPIVSYKGHGARRLGRIVARALSVLDKKDIISAIEWALKMAKQELHIKHFSIDKMWRGHITTSKRIAYGRFSVSVSGRLSKYGKSLEVVKESESDAEVEFR